VLEEKNRNSSLVKGATGAYPALRPYGLLSDALELLGFGHLY